MKPENYFYRPLAYCGGELLKCAGICTEENKGWCCDKFNKADPEGVYLRGVVIVEGYRGDKIDSDTLAPI